MLHSNQHCSNFIFKRCIPLFNGFKIKIHHKLSKDKEYRLKSIFVYNSKFEASVCVYWLWRHLVYYKLFAFCFILNKLKYSVVLVLLRYSNKF